MSLRHDLNERFGHFDSIELVGDYVVIGDGPGQWIGEKSDIRDWLDSNSSRGYSEFCDGTTCLYATHNSAGENVERDAREALSVAGVAAELVGELIEALGA
jgi:hypothetical protein